MIGAEFDWGRRMNFSGANRDARRIGAVIQFAF